MRGEDLERRLLWLISYEAFVEHPVVGVGYGGIGDRFDDAFGYVMTSHGFVTTLLGETGILGTILFLLVMLGYFRRIGRAIRAGVSDEKATSFLRASRAAMIGILVIGLFHQVYQDQIFYILLAWGYAAPEIVRLQSDALTSLSKQPA